MLPRSSTLGNLFVVRPQLSDHGFPMDFLLLDARSHNFFCTLEWVPPFTHFLVCLVHIVTCFLVKWRFEIYLKCILYETRLFGREMLRTRFEYGLKFHSSQTTNLVSAPLIVVS